MRTKPALRSESSQTPSSCEQLCKLHERSLFQEFLLEEIPFTQSCEVKKCLRCLLLHVIPLTFCHPLTRTLLFSLSILATPQFLPTCKHAHLNSLTHFLLYPILSQASPFNLVSSLFVSLSFSFHHSVPLGIQSHNLSQVLTLLFKSQPHHLSSS